MMTERLCAGTCNSRYRRAHAIYEAELAKWTEAAELAREAGQPAGEPPKPPDIDPVYGEPVWCPRCKAIIRRELAEIDELGASLANLPPGIRPASDGTRERVLVSGSRVTPSPSPSGDDLDDLYRWLLAWETYYRAVREWPAAPPRGFLADRRTSVVNALGDHLDGLLLTEGAAQFGTETRRWHRELVAKTHSARSAKHVKKQCPRCRQFTLWEELGESYIRCVNTDCNRRMTREELDQAVTV